MEAAADHVWSVEEIVALLSEKGESPSRKEASPT